ncbi:MAG: hypothetical protein ACOYPS_04570 [Phycisphaerales bacterium]|jgi:hypothetical protein
MPLFPHHRVGLKVAPRAAWLVVALGGGLVGGCGTTIRPDFDSPEPAARNAAIVNAAAREDRTAIPHLIRMLESDDPATRSLAISALERLTGQTHGFEAWETPLRRDEAVARWRDAIGQDTSVR